MVTARLVRRAKPAEAATRPLKARKARSGTPTANGAAKALRTAPRAEPGEAKAKRKVAGGTLDTMPEGGGGLWQIKGDMTVHFLSEPQPTDACPDHAAMWWFKQFWDDDNGKSGIVEEGEAIPDGARVTQRLAAAVWDLTDDGKNDRVKVLSLPVSLRERITKHFNRYGTVCDRVAYITKSGTGMTTKYDIEFDLNQSKIPARKLAEIRSSIDIGDMLEKEQARLAAMPARGPRKHSRKELTVMDLGEFRVLAKSLGLSTAGKKRSVLIDEILEAQA